MTTTAIGSNHRVIYRYDLDVNDQVQQVPYGQVVSARATSFSTIEVWLLHDGTTLQMDPAPLTRLMIFGTGQVIPAGWKHVVTCEPFELIGGGGRLVWHVFEEVGVHG